MSLGVSALRSWRWLVAPAVVLAVLVSSATGAGGAEGINPKELSVARQLDAREVEWVRLEQGLSSGGRRLIGFGVLVAARSGVNETRFVALAGDTSLRRPFRLAAANMALAWENRRKAGRLAWQRGQLELAHGRTKDRAAQARLIERIRKLARREHMFKLDAEERVNAATPLLRAFTRDTLGFAAFRPSGDGSGIFIVPTSTFRPHFALSLADGKADTSWFSQGVRDPAFKRDGWARVDIRLPSPTAISQVLLRGNGANRNPRFRRGFGFRKVRIVLKDGGGNTISQTRVAPPSSRELNVVVAHPMETEARVMTVSIQMTDHQNVSCGGFADVLLVGATTVR